MIRKFACLLAMLVLFVPVPMALAGGSGGSSKEKAAKGPVIPNLRMPMLVAPVMVDGRLKRYAFLGVMLELVADSYKDQTLRRVPYMQDAFLRDVHATSIGLPSDPGTVDTKGLAARLQAICDRVVGPGVVKDVTVEDTGKDFN